MYGISHTFAFGLQGRQVHLELVQMTGTIWDVTLPETIWGFNLFYLCNFGIYIRSLGVLTWNNGTSTLGRKHATSDTSLGKQKRDIFKLDPSCLRVEAVDHRDESSVEHGKDNECLPADVRYGKEKKLVGVEVTTAFVWRKLTYQKIWELF